MNEYIKKHWICITIVIVMFILFCSILYYNRKTTDTVGEIERTTTESYTDARIDTERLNGTVEELERTVEESADIFAEIRKQNTIQK